MNDLITKDQIKSFSIDWNYCLDNFLRTQNGLAYKTIKAYRSGVSCFLDYLTEQDIPKPLPDDIHDYLGYLREKVYSVFTIGLYMISLKKFFAYLAQPYKSVGAASIKIYEDIYKMASPQLKRPSRKKHHREMPTEEEVQKLRDVLQGPDQKSRRDLLMVDMALFCGLRINEIANLRVEDVRKDEDKYKLYVLRKGQVSRNYYVFLDVGIAERLLDYAQEYRLKRYIFTDLYHKKNKKDRLNTCSVSSVISGALTKAGVKRPTLTAHSLRHYAGTTYYQTTKDLYATQQFMGHRDSATTEIYMHVENNYSVAGIALCPA